MIARGRDARARVERFRSRKELAKARYAAAKAQLAISEAVVGISSELQEAGLRAERAMERAEEMNLRAEVIRELESIGNAGGHRDGRGRHRPTASPAELRRVRRRRDLALEARAQPRHLHRLAGLTWDLVGRSAIIRCAGGGIIRSSVAIRYQLGLLRLAGSLIAPPSASRPHGTCESAMNAASRAGTSAANESANFSRSRKRNPFCGGRIGG